MIQSFLIFALCAMGHAFSYLLLANIVMNDKFLKKYFLISVFILGFTVLTQSILLSLFFLAFLCLINAKNLSSSERIILFIGLIFVLPNSPAFYLNFGANFGQLSHIKVLVISLLIPIFSQPRKRFEYDKLNIIDYLAFSFLFWVMFRNVSHESITVVLRENTWILIQYVFPYTIIRFYLRDYFPVFVAISFGLLAQSFISIFEAIFQWKIYESLIILSGYADYYETAYKYRHGFIRTEAVYENSLILALFGNFSFLCAYLMKQNAETAFINYRKRFLSVIAMLVSLLGTFFTGSRAGLAGIVMVFFVVFILSWSLKQKKNLRNKLTILAIGSIFLLFYFGQEFIQTEFPYRTLLFQIAKDVIQSNPLTGSLDILIDPRMEVLRQGEGIIDLVNTYIYITLYYGLVGLVFFTGSIVSAFNKLYLSLRELNNGRSILGLFVCCSILIMIFNLATVSPIGMTYEWIWILIPICSNIVASHRSEVELGRRRKAAH